MGLNSPGNMRTPAGRGER